MQKPLFTPIRSRRELTQASHTDKIKTKDTNSFRLLDHEIYGRIFNSKTADILSSILGVSSITVNGNESSSHTPNETSDLSLVNPLPFPDQDASQSLESGVRLDGLVHFLLLQKSHSGGHSLAGCPHFPELGSHSTILLTVAGDVLT